MGTFQLPAETHIGHAHFYVGDLSRSIDFYGEKMGFKVVRREGDHAVLSADGATPHILLTARAGWQPKPKRTTGLYHVAIRVPSRGELARVFQRLVAFRVPFGGFSDHAVSEALYLDDPDGNGLEIYRDRPRSEWRVEGNQVQVRESTRQQLTQGRRPPGDARAGRAGLAVPGRPRRHAAPGRRGP